jgi:hypothetical protein
VSQTNRTDRAEDSHGSEPRPPTTEPPVPRLSQRQFWACLAVAVVIFLFGTGPIWRHPWDLDTAILCSYLPVPLLVLVLLAWSRRLTFRGFLLDTLTLTLVKFTITLSIALVLWNVSPPPAKPVAAPVPVAPPQPAEPPPAPTPIAPESTGALQGVVAGPDGAPVAGALVFVEKGLEQYVFAPPSEPLRLENDGAAVTPRLSAAQTYQPISARSTDGHLHTLVAASAEGPLFNVPLLSSGVPSTLTVREPHGISRIRCAVHQGDTEKTSYLAVLGHPFFAITGADGRFSWTGVPAGQLRIGAFDPELGQASAPAELAPRGSADVRLSLSTAR